MNFFKSGVTFNPTKDIPALEGKVILVTGGNIGLGKEAILQYTKHNPKQIWLAARNGEKATAAINEIKQQVPASTTELRFLELDLTSFESIKKAASTFSAEAERLDILMLNAGVMALPPGTTKEGYEIQFGTNHMGHALFTKLLVPVLEKSATAPNSDVRVVVVSSLGHRLAPSNPLDLSTIKTDCKNLGTYQRYGNSKLANILFAREMAKRYPQFKTVSIHPGVVNTNLYTDWSQSSILLKPLMKLSSLVMTTVESGVKNQLWASVSPEVVSGEYYVPVGIGASATGSAVDDGLAGRLWEYTEKETEGYSA